MSPSPGSRLVRSVAAVAMTLAASQVVAAAEQPPAVEQAAAQSQRFLLLAADRQSVDGQLGKLIAEGRVQARFDGWVLYADRVEVLEATRTVYASGRIRLIRGDQTLQAGRLRYSELEGSGELEDVYGVIDQEVLDRQLSADSAAAAAAESSTDTGAEPGVDVDSVAADAVAPETMAVDSGPDFACPELSRDPRRRTLAELVPPRLVALPTLPAPAGCPGAESSPRPRGLRELLTDVAMGTPPGSGPDELRAEDALSDDGEPIEDGPDGREIRQRVSDVRLRQSLDASVRFDLVAVVESDPETTGGNPAGPSVLRRPKPEQGRLNRLRFQASTVRVSGNRWSAREIAFTNDPFTPARSWLIGYGVEARLAENGVTRIRAQRTRILLSNRLSVPGINNTTIGEEGTQVYVGADRRDRDGLYLGYNLPTLPLGRKGTLDLQPQFMLQRAIEGRTDSYTKPGGSLAGPRVNQDLGVGDLFGLVGALETPVDRFRLRAKADLSTLNPDNFEAGSRATAVLSTPVGLPGHDSAQLGAFASYREQILNGSLGRQTVVHSYGGQLEGSLMLNRPAEADPIDRNGPTPSLAPVRIDWSAISGSYRAELFDSDTLDTQWRTRLSAIVRSSLQLWEAPLDPERRDLPALRYSAVPIRPGLALDFGVVGTSAFYQSGDQQNTLTLFGGPAVTLGRFREPWFDYTQLELLVGGTLRDGLSPFSFDRAVDLRTLSFRASQQLYGPLVLEAGATVNIDDRSRFYGDISYSYVELKLLQRSYELGVFYSPYDGTGGIRVKLNDFSFGGSGTPFVPRPLSAGGQQLSEGP